MSNPNQQLLLDKIALREATVAIIGLGYVGLPLAVAFAEAGFNVVGIDLDEGKVGAILQGESYIKDVPAETIARLAHYKENFDTSDSTLNGAGSCGSLAATTDFRVLEDSDVVIICVPTPVSKTKDPDMSYIVAATEEIAQRLHPGMLVVLESTSYPGTTEELILPRFQNHNGVKFSEGVDFFLAFSPERIDPGNQTWSVVNTPKVIGGVTPDCMEVARTLYETAIQEVVPVSSTKAAEMVKLLENTFRATNIALVNEVAIMCGRLGIDVWEVIDAAKTKPFGFMPFYPGPGLGGHCIPVDPEYLAWKLRTLNYNARFIELASEINLGMPAYVLEKITDALEGDGKSLGGSQVMVLGVTYKEDVGDLRESPALDVIRLMRERDAVVTYHDPYVPSLEVDGSNVEFVEISVEALRRSDCVVITTAHSFYDWSWILEHSRLVVDTRNATKGGSAASVTGRVVKI